MRSVYLCAGVTDFWTYTAVTLSNKYIEYLEACTNSKRYKIILYTKKNSAK